MRIIASTLHRYILGFSEFLVRRNKSSYLLAGSFGLLLMSVQVSQAITDSLLQLYNTARSNQQGFSLMNPTASEIGHWAVVPLVASSATSQKDELDVTTATPKIIAAEFASAEGRETETGQITGTRDSNDALMREKLALHVKTNYKISGAMAKEIVTAAISLSRKNGMDPFLTLGIIASESSFNHKAKSGYGASGLMQVYGPVHRNVLEDLGVSSKNPKIVHKILSEQIHLNVAAGIRIYKTYEKQYGSQAKALQAYNGAKGDASYSYANKVLAMREQLQRVAAFIHSDS